MAPRGVAAQSTAVMGPIPYTKRRERVRRMLAEERLDACVVTHPPNLYYLCGFTGSSGALLVGAEACVLLTDGRYSTQARSEVQHASVRIVKKGLLAGVSEALRGRQKARIGLEASHMSIGEKIALERLCGQGIRLHAMKGSIEGIRAVKDPGELEKIREAARLGSRVFEKILPRVRPGVRETDLAAEIEFQMRKLGAERPAFDTIVACGARSALPHARPTDKRLKKNELVVLDLGAILRHYCCDLTRTVYLGRPPARIQSWYAAVRDAQAAAIESLKAGTTGGAADQAARRVLARARLGRYFVHSTGHGLGLEVHEEPRLARGSKQELETGQVVTVEPGVYIAGVGGIRIEDDVIIGRGGSETITSAPRELLQL